MLKVIILIAILGLVLMISNTARAAFTETIGAKDNAAYSQEAQVAFAVADLSRKEVEQLIDRRLSLFERINLKIMQHRLRKELKQAYKSGTSKNTFSVNYFDSKNGNNLRLILLVAIVLLAILFFAIVVSTI